MQLIVIQNHSLQLLSNQIYINIKMWRRERDSNPRNGFPFTRFPSVRLQPLGHLSVRRKTLIKKDFLMFSKFLLLGFLRLPLSYQQK